MLVRRLLVVVLEGIPLYIMKCVRNVESKQQEIRILQLQLQLSPFLLLLS
jgi:hypothetical protein